MVRRFATSLAFVLLATACSVDTSAIAPTGGSDAGADSAVGGDAEPPDGTADASDTGARDTDVPDAIVRPDGGCASPESCADGTLSTCDATGAPITIECPLGCASGEPRCAELEVSNVPGSFLDPSAPALTWNSALTVDTSACAEGTVVTQAGGGEACVISAGTLDVSNVVRVTGSRPLILVAFGPVAISGEIDVSAYGNDPGPGGGVGGRSGAVTGAGASGGTVGTNDATWADGGGSGGGFCGAGGDGGDGAYSAFGASGGRAVDPGELSPLVGGSGGGWGNGSGGNDADGGGGGGALQITSAVSIRISGRIRAGGGGGEGGAGMSGNWGAGAGGGSGGAVLLEAPEVEVAGRIFAGGGGGGGSGGGNFERGDSGQDAADVRDNAAGGAASGGTYSADGGDGGGGTSLDGVTGQDNTIVGSGNGGGGGGGAGCILVRNADGVLPSSLDDENPRVPVGLRAMRLRVR